MNKKLIFLLGTLAAAVLLFWIFNPARSTDFETVTPVRTKAVQAVYATGTVEARRMIPVSPRIAARLMTLAVDEGAKVEAGQILGQLEDTDVKQNLAELEARLELADKDYARAQKLAKTGAISKSALDTSTTEFTAAQAAVERARAELGYLQLVAPEAGTIIRRDGEIGELITVGTAVFWMNGGGSLRIETEVDEEDIGLVAIGQDVVIRADAFPDQTFEGKVQAITPKGDAVARSYRVRVSLPEQTPLLIGMTAETNIITQVKESALMVPATAVKGDNLYIAKNGKPHLTKIKKGIVTDKTVEILEGVAQEDKIVLRYNDIASDEGEREKAVCNMGTGC